MEEKEIQHKVTAQDLENNPELTQSGVTEGVIIGIPAEDTEAPEDGAALTNSPE